MGVLGAEVQERGDIVPVADSLHCTVEINTTLQSNYTPIKKKKWIQLHIHNKLIIFHSGSALDSIKEIDGII